MTGARDTYERARRPAEKAARRALILEAAARLLDRGLLQDVSLNAIAQEAGLSKPNLYRYFESREDILLALFIEDLRGFRDQVVAATASVQPGSPGAAETVAEILVDAYDSRPRLCRFLGMIASVFEHNVSAEVIVALKTTSLDLATEVAAVMQQALPTLALERCLWINNMTSLLVAGLWPPAHPAPVVVEVLAKPEFQALRPDFRRDLKEGILSLIRGS